MTWPTPEKLEDLSFPLAPSLLASSIQSTQKVPATPVSWLSQIKKKSPSGYKKDRVEKYAKYFKNNEILPIPELVEAVEPKTVLRSHRLI